MKESRLFQILYYLLERGQATGPELAEKLEVSVRTIYRDIDALSEAGIPVYAERGRDGGVRLMENFVLDKALFSNAEKQTILDAIQNLAVIEQAEGNALRKLSALFGIQPENWVEIDFSKWGSAPWEEQKFTLLKTAILSHRVVEILYAGANGSMKRGTGMSRRIVWKGRISGFLKSAGLSRRQCLQRYLCRCHFPRRRTEGKQSSATSNFVFPGRGHTGFMMNLI